MRSAPFYFVAALVLAFVALPARAVEQYFPGEDISTVAPGVYITHSSPGITSDSTQGFVIGSRWINLTDNSVWTAVSVAPGAAIWVQNTSATEGGGTTGSGAEVLTNSPVLISPNLGTPSMVNLANATGLPILTGLSGLGTGVATALGNAAGAAGGIVTIGGALGTPSSGTLTNATGLPVAGLTGLGTGVGTALGVAMNTSGGIPSQSGAITAGNCLKWSASGGIQDTGAACSAGGVQISGTPSANLIAQWVNATSIQALATTGTGNAVLATSPTLTTPNLGTPSAATLTNATGLPVAGISGLGTGVAGGLAAATNAANGLSTLSGAITPGDCLTWSLTGLADANSQCGASSAGGRLTLATGTPVIMTNVIGATSVFYTPYLTNVIPIWNAAQGRFVGQTFTEVSQTLADTTKSPAAAAPNSVYSVFCWNDVATFRCTRGPAWPTLTSPGTGAGSSQLSLVQGPGFYVNAVSITNGPAAAAGTYVGSFHTNVSGTVDFIFAKAQPGGGPGVIGVWNYFNRAVITMKNVDTGGSYTYTSSTIRYARGSAGNLISFIVGVPEDSIQATRAADLSTLNVNGACMETGIGLDSPTSFDNDSWSYAASPGAVSLQIRPSITDMIPPQQGWHIVSANEQSDGTNASTFNSDCIDSIAVTMRY